MLGRYLAKTAPDIYDVSCTFFPSNKEKYIYHHCRGCCLDVSDRGMVLSTIKKTGPDYVVHTASIASVDYVEKNKEEAKKTNLGGTKNIIEACRESGARLVYISSNAVFDGKNPPYSEEDPVSPVNYYGELKAEEENAVKSSGLQYAIVRPILMYGWNLEVERKNPVTWLIDLLKAGTVTNVVDDVLCNPLFVKDCSDAIWKIIASNEGGVFHVGGEDVVSRYELACFTAKTFGFDTNLIKPVKSSFFTGIASRPQNTTYCTGKIKKKLQIFPLGVVEGLEAMKSTQNENT